MSNLETKEFVLAREIIDNLATERTTYIPLRSNGREFLKYEDDYIQIIAGIDTKAMHIEINNPLTGASSNPIIYVDDEGNCYRNHGERIYFIVYAEALLGKTDVARLYGHGVERAEQIRALVKEK